MRAEIIGGKGGHERHSADFYPTPTDVTEALLRAFPQFLSGVVWEPACGDGAISKVIARMGGRTVDTDLRVDSGFGEGGIDFLKAVPPPGASFIVTNPPFNLSAEFIRRASETRLPFAMVLRGTYWHAKTRLPLFKDTAPSYVCPLLWRPAMAPERGTSPVMEFAWTVWLNDKTECRYFPLERPLTDEIDFTV
jgi:hypothetical protein